MLKHTNIFERIIEPLSYLHCTLLFQESHDLKSIRQSPKYNVTSHKKGKEKIMGKKTSKTRDVRGKRYYPLLFSFPFSNDVTLHFLLCHRYDISNMTKLTKRAICYRRTDEQTLIIKIWYTKATKKIFRWCLLTKILAVYLE